MALSMVEEYNDVACLGEKMPNQLKRKKERERKKKVFEEKSHVRRLS